MGLQTTPFRVSQDSSRVSQRPCHDVSDSFGVYQQIVWNATLTPLGVSHWLLWGITSTPLQCHSDSFGVSRRILWVSHRLLWGVTETPLRCHSDSLGRHIDSFGVLHLLIWGVKVTPLGVSLSDDTFGESSEDPKWKESSDSPMSVKEWHGDPMPNKPWNKIQWRANILMLILRLNLRILECSLFRFGSNQCHPHIIPLYEPLPKGCFVDVDTPQFYDPVRSEMSDEKSENPSN